MKRQTIDVFRCDYCNKLYQREYHCKNHEERCTYNPLNNRACFGCVNLCKKSTIVTEDLYDGEYERKVNLLYCDKVNTFLYPPRVQHDKKWFETHPISNEPMPLECQHRKHWSDEPLFRL